jgi:hypothetical protein
LYIVSFNQNEVHFKNPFSNAAEAIGFKFGGVYLIQKQVVKNLRIIRNDFIIQQQQIKDNQYNNLQQLSTIYQLTATSLLLNVTLLLHQHQQN